MKLKALIIEDNEQNMYMLSFLLKNNNFEVYTATSGELGIQIAEEIVPDVILLDIQLPEMDGYMVARQIREFETLKLVPIVAVTSYAMHGDKEKVLKAGATGYIEKPIEPETFMRQLNAFLA